MEKNKNVRLRYLNAAITVNKAIHAKYDEGVKKLEETKNEKIKAMKYKLDLIANYSSFPVSLIGPILADIVTLYSGRPYFYKKEDYNSPKVQAYLESVNKDKIVIATFDSYGPEPEITFYDYDFRSIDGRLSIERHELVEEYGNYLKKFVDFLVQYRLDNNLEKVDLKILKQIEVEFVKNNIGDIKKAQKEHYRLDQELVENNKREREAFLTKIIDAKDITC